MRTFYINLSACDERMNSEMSFHDPKHHHHHRNNSWPSVVQVGSSYGRPDQNDSMNLDEQISFKHPSSYPLTKVQNAIVSQIKRDEIFLTCGPSTSSTLKSAKSDEAPVSPSAYRAYLAQRAKRLSDPSAAPSPPIEQEIMSYPTSNSSNVILKEAKRRCSYLKSALKEYESNFENKHGNKPTFDQKMSSPIARSMIMEINKLKKGMKEIKSSQILTDADFDSTSVDDRELPHLLMASKSSGSKDFLKKSRHAVKHKIVNLDLTDLDSFLKSSAAGDSSSVIEAKLHEDILNEILDTLSAKRRTANRPELLESMSSDEILDEKLDLQKALLRFESNHGRPSTKIDRDIMRPVYDRYRIVKRMVVRMPKSVLMMSTKGSSVVKGPTGNVVTASDPLVIGSNSELQPILEHCVMTFGSGPVSSPATMESSDSGGRMQEPDSSNLRSCHSASEVEQPRFSQFSKKSHGISSKDCEQNLHELPLIELLTQLRESRSEKKYLKKIIKDFEEEFIRTSGRKVEKEDRTSLESVYSNYKVYSFNCQNDLIIVLLINSMSEGNSSYWRHSCPKRRRVSINYDQKETFLPEICNWIFSSRLLLFIGTIGGKADRLKYRPKNPWEA